MNDDTTYKILVDLLVTQVSSSKYKPLYIREAEIQYHRRPPSPRLSGSESFKSQLIIISKYYVSQRIRFSAHYNPISPSIDPMNLCIRQIFPSSHSYVCTGVRPQTSLFISYVCACAERSKSVHFVTVSSPIRTRPCLPMNGQCRCRISKEP